jgi:hypothetical protein
MYDRIGHLPREAPMHPRPVLPVEELLLAVVNLDFQKLSLADRGAALQGVGKILVRAVKHVGNPQVSGVLFHVVEACAITKRQILTVLIPTVGGPLLGEEMRILNHLVIDYVQAYEEVLFKVFQHGLIFPNIVEGEGDVEILFVQDQLAISVTGLIHLLQTADHLKRLVC